MNKKSRTNSAFFSIFEQNEIMNIQNEILIETKGLSETIFQYTNNNYIRSYATQLTMLNVMEDKDLYVIVLEKLGDWYAKEIENISKDEYVVNKEEHLKSYELITKWLDYFQNEEQTTWKG